MEIIRYILFCQVFIAFFVAGGIFFKSSSLKSRTLAALVALTGFHILLFLYGSGRIANLYPDFRSWFYYEVAFLLGPLIFIHLQSLLLDKKKLVWIDVLHFIPIIIFWFYYGDVLIMEAQERVAYINANFDSRTMFWNYTLAFQMVVYAVACLVLLYVNRKKMLNDNIQYALFLVIAYMSSTILIAYLTHYASGWRDFQLYYLVNTVFIFGIGYLLYTKPQFLQQIKKKYFNSSLDRMHMKEIEKKIDHVFKTQHLHLNNNLSIDVLANALNEKQYHVSQTFSEHLNLGFNDYVNKYRILEAKKRLRDEQYKNYKIEAIAIECGFNNKVTFYKAFSKFANDTPSKFRKRK